MPRKLSQVETGKYNADELRLFRDPKQVFKHALQNLNPGGFIEYHDFLTNYQSIDGSSRGTAIERSGILFREALMRKGYDPDAPFKYKDWMIEAGRMYT